MFRPLRLPSAAFFTLALAALVTSPAHAQLAAPAPTPAPAPAPTPAPLTLEECVARALNQNFDLQLQQFATQNARDSVITADASFDPTLFSSVAAAGARDSTVSPTRNTRDQAASLGVSQLLASGATAQVSTALDRSKESPFVAPPLFNPVYNSDLALSVNQPLLQGFGVTITRATFEKSRLGVTRAQYDFKDAVLTVIRNVESAYYILAFAREQLVVRKLSLAVAQTLFDENTIRQRTGVATSLDVLQSEVGVANARRDLLLAEQAVSDREDALLNLVGRFANAQRPGPVRLSDEPAPAVSFDLSYALALANAPELASNQLLAEQLKLDLAVAKNNRLPTLDLGAAVGLNGADRRNATSALNSSASGDSYDLQVDLTLSIPWGLRAERAKYRQARTNLTRQETAIAKLDQNLLVDVRAAVRAVDTNRETVTVSVLATELSRKQFEAEKARYEAGRSTYRFVEDARRDYDTARVNELLARVNMRIAVAELSRLEGSSLTRYQVKLEK
jgi:outer membrane protein